MPGLDSLAATFDEMSSLSRGLRARLAAEFSLHRIEPAFVAESADGTRKLLFHLPGERGFPAAAIERTLGVTGTMRNWNTVAKMLEIAERIEGSGRE